MVTKRKNRVVPAPAVRQHAPMNTHRDAFVDSRDFARIARAIRFIEENFRAQPRLATIAQSARLSEFHFNRLFRRWAGITPRQYLAYVTHSAARRELQGCASVLDAVSAEHFQVPSGKLCPSGGNPGLASGENPPSTAGVRLDEALLGNAAASRLSFVSQSRNLRP